MRKGIRKVISALLVVIVIFASVPLAGFVGLELPEINLLGTKAEAAISGKCGDNLTWTFDDIKYELVISGTGDMYDYSVSSVTPNTPWFKYHTYIDNIIISDGVTSIGNCAFFRCESLKSIIIPDSVTSIGVIAFTYCESLTSITLGNGIKTIGNSAFSFCSKLTNMTIPDSVTSIGYDLLLGCGRFEDVYFMGSEVEWNEISITSDNSDLLMSTIHFAKNISEGTCGMNLKWAYNSTTCELVISGTGNMYDYSYEVSQYKRGPAPWHSVCSKIKSVTVKDGVTSIGGFAFFNCYDLTSITLPYSLVYISDCALGYCAVTDVYYNGTEEEWNSILIRDTNYALLEATIHFAESPIQGTCGDNLAWTFNRVTGELAISGTGDMYDYDFGKAPWYVDNLEIRSINIGNGVTSIGDCAFYCCEALERITIPDSVTSVGFCAFYWCTGLENIAIPNSVTNIGVSAFEGCGLTSITIPDSITSISDGTFYHCFSLEDITLPDSVTSIGSHAFYYCESLTNITIPDKVTSISDNTFQYCDKLESVTLPDGIASIGDSAFYNCRSLSDVYYTGTEEEWNAISIGSNNEYLLKATIHFNYVEPITGTCGDNLTWALDDSTGELIVSGTGDMYNYGDEVAPWFEYFEIIKSVEISDGVTSIGDCAFGGCENLADVSIGNDITSIGYAAFTYCIGLTDVIIPDSVTSIGAGAFADCPDLISAVIGNSVITIGDGAFANCQGLTSITIPDSVTSIGQSAFYNCSFTSITVGSANTSYSNDEYGVLFNKDKTELILYPVGNERTSYEIPDGITSITDYAFQYCANLTSITIPDSVTSIGENTFGSCTGLVSITIPDSITDIPYCAFEFCDSLTNAVIGNNVTSIGKGAFYDCENLASVVIPDSVTSIDNYAFNNCNSLSDIYYTGTEEEWNAISIGSYNNEPLSKATIHYNYIVPCNHSYDSEITTEVTCTENGVETFTCSKCGDVYTEVIPSNGHTRGEWEIVIESTTETEGKKIKKCLSCGETVEEAIILRNTVITDDKTGIGVEINRDDYDGEAQVVVEETSDDSVFNIVNTETNAVRTKIYDINITVDGKETQPKGTVKVRIPLPDGYNPLYTVVYHVDTVTSTIENMDAVVETINGKMYLVFETTHFSYYAIVDKSEITMSIRTPSATTIKCGDSIVLHADLNEALPDGWKIEWIASNNNFSYSVSSDGTTCTITPSKSGDTTFTAVVCDAKGNAVSADEQTMTSKAGFFDKIIAFFKKLFGMTKVIPQAFKGIY